MDAVPSAPDRRITVSVAREPEDVVGQRRPDTEVKAIIMARTAGKMGMRALILGSMLCVSGAACTPLARWATGGWVADYDTAEALVRRSGKDLLVYYQGKRGEETDLTGQSLKNGKVRRRLAEFVCCKLFKAYEPDRRYVQQYHVRRAPALILVHADGTYHAHAGRMHPEDVIAFLDQTKTLPSHVADTYRHIPRRPEYVWLDRADAARSDAENANRPILFVFHRVLTNDWRRLEDLLERPEVFTRFGPMTHCRLSSLSKKARDEAARCGVEQWPALVIAEPDGTARILESPAGYEQIVRFADGRPPPEMKSGDDTAASVSAP